MKSLLKWVSAMSVVVAFSLTSCALKYPNPGVDYQGIHTDASHAISLFPLPAAQRNIQLVIHSSPSSPLNWQGLQQDLTQVLNAKGYRMQTTSSAADIQMTLNILLAGTTSIDVANDLLLQGFGAPVKPSGEIVLGQQQYLSTAVKSAAVYAVVIDMTIIIKKQKKYQTRLVSLETNLMQPTYFAAKQPMFNQAIAQFIGAIF